jgi:protein-S-isoprenylcysteine O-methyltransferase Ste14
MRRSAAAVGAAAFFALAPGVVAGLVPWWLTRWEVRPYWLPLRVAGAVFVALGALVLLHAFIRFVVEGVGTPAPIAPTQRLVVGGLYQYVRNPMYLAVVTVILGQWLLLGQPVLLWYGLAVGVTMAAFARWYEEPALREQFGAEYEAYRSAVPAWLPRRRPWKPG